jgi:hypothetical protein
MLQRFVGGATPEALAKLNALVDELNTLGGLRGDSFLQVSRGPGGLALSLNIDAVRARIPKRSPNGTNIEIELDGGGSAITSSLPVAGRFERVPFGCTILGWRVKADVSGSVAVDILRNGTSIVGGGTKPALSSSADSTDQVPTGWTSVDLVEDDILTYSISGTPATLTYAKVILWVQ